MPLSHHMASSLEECIRELVKDGQPTFPGYTNGTAWCNGTWDSILCWPAIPANTSYTLPCPPLRGLLRGKHVEKFCHESARWAGRDEFDFRSDYGYTNYKPCMDTLNIPVFEEAHQLAINARRLELVGLTLSLFSLIVAVTIFSVFKRLRVFRNQIHQQLMLAMLLTIVIRLTLYIDLSFSIEISRWVHGSEIGYTINSTKVVCEIFYILLEYFKTVVLAFVFIEGFYLHNIVVVRVFQASEPVLRNYLIAAWGIPVIHIIIWLAVMMGIRGQFSFEVCLGAYYMKPEYWILEGIRLLELAVTLALLLNVARVLWLKVRGTQNALEVDNLKKGVITILMLIALLVGPSILNMIPITPNYGKILFAVFTYFASVFSSFQGLMVAVLFCFANREVINVIKSRGSRFKSRHQSTGRKRHSSVEMCSEKTQLQTNIHDEKSNIYRDARYMKIPDATTGFNQYNDSRAMHNIENDQLSNNHELRPLVSSVNRPDDYNPSDKKQVP